MNALLHKFHRKKDRDKLMQEYYGKIYASWTEYFHPCKDQKVVFLMLMSLPERLIILTQDGSQLSHQRRWGKKNSYTIIFIAFLITG